MVSSHNCRRTGARIIVKSSPAGESSPLYLKVSDRVSIVRATLERLSRREGPNSGVRLPQPPLVAPSRSRAPIRSGFHEPSATSHTHRVARTISRVHGSPCARHGWIIARFAPITATKVAMVENASVLASERASGRTRRRELPRTASSRESSPRERDGFPRSQSPGPALASRGIIRMKTGIIVAP